MLKAFHMYLNMSVPLVANKIGSSAFNVHRTKCKNSLKTYKVQKVPDREQVKELDAKRRARKLYADYLIRFECVIMDD